MLNEVCEHLICHGVVCVFQERGYAEYGGCEATAASVPDRSLTIVHSDQRAVSGSDQVVPIVPGPYEWRWERSQSRYRGVSVAIQAQAMELLYCA